MLELASRGDERNVSMFSDDLLPKGADGSNDDETIYTKGAGLDEPLLIYSFAKATRSAKG